MDARVLTPSILLSVLVCIAANAAGPNKRRTEILDAVSRTLDERYYDPTFGGKDWKGIQNRYRSVVLGAETQELFYQKLNEMLFQLEVSHLCVIPKDHPEWIGAPSLSSDGGVGIEARIIDDKAVITRIKAGSPAFRQRLRPGMIIESINGKTLADLRREVLSKNSASPLDRRLLLAQELLQQFYGPSGTRVTIVCKEAGGKEIEATMKREPRPGRVQFAEGIPPTFIEFEARRIGSDYGYIRFNIFHPALEDRLLAAVGSMQGTKGLVIDLRGNTGGVFGVRLSLAERMISKRSLCWKYRRRTETQTVYLEPTDQPYTKPLVIITDVLSCSSAEEFPGALQAMGRAVVVGERTPGMVLTADIVALPGGDTLVYPNGETMTSDGTVLEGRGVIPDIKAQHTAKALSQGRDLPLEAALRYLRSKRNP